AAAEPLAEAAIGAWTKAQTERVCVGLRQVSGRLREWLVAQFARGLAEQRVAEGLGLRRRRIGPRARPLEWIAAVQDLSLHVSGLPRRSTEILEAIVERLELVIGEAPVLNGHVSRQERCAVAFGEMCPRDEI